MKNHASETASQPLPQPDNRLKARLLRLISLRGDPSYLALSFAIGVFISFTPIWGLHSFLGLGIALIFQLDLACMMIGVWLNNPFSAPIIYGLCYWIGKTTLNTPVINPDLSWAELIKAHAGPVLLDLSVGCLLLGCFSSILSYFLLRTGIQLYRKSHPHIDRHER